MATSNFGSTQANNTTAPPTSVQPGFVDPGGLLQPGNLDGSGNIKVAVTGAGSGGTSSVDEATFAEGVTAGTPAMGVYEAVPTTLANNELGIVGVTANRELKVSGTFSSASVGVVGDAVPLSADQIGFADPAGDLAAFALESFDYDTGGGTQAQTAIGLVLPASGGPVPVGASNPLPVAGTGAAGTADAGVVTVQGIASMTPVQVSQATASNLNAQVVGNVAHDSADSGNPVKAGGKAVALGSNPTGVTAGDRTDWYFNRAGVPFVLGGHPNILTLEAAYTAAQTDTAIITVSAGTKIVVTQIQAIAGAATSVNVALRIGFAAATTPTTTGVVLSHPGILALSGSGASRGDGSGIIGVGADGEDLRITSGAATSGELRVVVSYFTIES